MAGFRGQAVLIALAMAACSSTAETSAPTTVVATPAASQPAATAPPASPSSPTTTTAVLTSLPIGDGRRSTAPESGAVFACQTTFGPAGGAFRDGPWIRSDGTWDPSAKLHVQGDVRWPNAQFSSSVQGAIRAITTNGVPANVGTGTFPVDAADPAYQYDRNPNTITPRVTTYTVPAAPAAAAAPSCVNMGAIGVLLDGVALFNALDAQGRDAAAHEILDTCDGHPERTGQYHRHTVPSPSCLLAQRREPSTLVGYALDGFGIFVERHPDGRLLTNADLDGCHGRTSPVAWDGATAPVPMYHYVATLEYPYTVGCFKGAPTRG